MGVKLILSELRVKVVSAPCDYSHSPVVQTSTSPHVLPDKPGQGPVLLLVPVSPLVGI